MERTHTILITGAGSGMGRGLCVELAGLGHRICVTDQNFDTANQTVQMLPEPDRGSAHELDVTDANDIERFLADPACAEVDVLINNAGLQHVAPLEKFPQEKWDQLIDVMLTGTYRMTRAILPQMRRREFGRIIIIGSIHSLFASPYKTAYAAAKHGLAGFAKVMALETADTDITINLICPSYVRTPLVDNQIAAQAVAHNISRDEVIDQIMLKPMPKKVFITYPEIAAAANYLIGDAARNISGHNLMIDGGWSVQ